jgi:hypothetical protein
LVLLDTDGTLTPFGGADIPRYERTREVPAYP